MKKSFVAAVGATILWAGAGAAQAQTFQATGVRFFGCEAHDFIFDIVSTDVEPSHVVRTQVRDAAGAYYMNERTATSGIAIATLWAIYDTMNYGPLPPSTAPFPMPAGERINVDFTLEKLDGTVLYQSHAVIDDCSTGALSSIGPGPSSRPTPVPTLSEWAMILLGAVLAGGAALTIQRRRTA